MQYQWIDINDQCLASLSRKQFITLTNDPSKSLESKVQQTLRKLKLNFKTHEYKRLYPTGSCPVKFYGTAKIHKIPVNGTIDDLPIRLTVSNRVTIQQSCNLGKYLSNFLAPLRESEYIKSTKDIIRKVNVKEVPHGYQIFSFDVKSPFTNVSLYRTVYTILKRIYDEHEFQTSITR